MKVYTPDHSIIYETNADISNRVNISRPINLVQYDSLPVIKVNLYYGHERYTIPDGIDLVRLRMGRLPSQYYYKDILGWSSDKQSVYIQVEEDMTKDIGEFGLVIEFIKFDYESSKNRSGPYLKNPIYTPYLGGGDFNINYNNANTSINMVYNIYDSSYTVDGSTTQRDDWNLTAFNIGDTGTLSYVYKSGNMLGKPFAINNKGKYNWIIRSQSLSIVSSHNTRYGLRSGDLLSFYTNELTTFNDFKFQLQLEEGTEATEFEPPIKLMIAASSKVNVIVERNPVEGFSRNLAMPDINNKPYLGDGWYQLQVGRNGSIELRYNIFTCRFRKIIHEVESAWAPIGLRYGIFNIEEGKTYTLQHIRYSGIGDIYSYITDGRTFSNQLSKTGSNSHSTKILQTPTKWMDEWYINTYGVMDTEYYIQLEEGPVATPWTPPNKQETEVK